MLGIPFSPPTQLFHREQNYQELPKNFSHRRKKFNISIICFKRNQSLPLHAESLSNSIFMQVIVMCVDKNISENIPNIIWSRRRTQFGTTTTCHKRQLAIKSKRRQFATNFKRRQLAAKLQRRQLATKDRTRRYVSMKMRGIVYQLIKLIDRINLNLQITVEKKFHFIND